MFKIFIKLLTFLLWLRVNSMTCLQGFSVSLLFPGPNLAIKLNNSVFRFGFDFLADEILGSN